MNEQSNLTMADYAELWMKESGYTIPGRDTEEWKQLYAKWVDYAFDHEKHRNRYLGVE